MKLLLIDTSGPVCGAAVLDGDRVAASAMAHNLRTHSVNLMPMVEGVLETAGLTLDAMDRLACVVGPGSFTGVRLGVSTVKGLAHGAGLPCVAVNALEALAAGAGDFDGVICPILDARAGQVYCAVFRSGHPAPERLTPDTPLALEDCAALAGGLGERVLFLGDGMSVHRQRLAELLGSRAVFAPPYLSSLNPAAAAYLASLSEKTVDYLHLEPLYLRAPSAERSRRLTEAAAAEAKGGQDHG